MVKNLFIFPLILTVSCSYESNLKVEETPTKNIVSPDTSILKISPHWLNPPIEILELYSPKKIGFTSSGPYNKSLVDSCFNSKNRIFGRYHLINRQTRNQDPRIGYIDIHRNGESHVWRASDSSQVIEKLHITNEVLLIWDSIRVGISLENARKFCDDNKGISILKGDSIYLSIFKNYKVKYLLKNNIVTEITATLTCQP